MEGILSKSGFTLVEMAIVILVVGVLAAGILAGRQFVTQGKLVATIAAIRSYSGATAIFLDQYGGLPGDLPDAGSRIPGCAPFADACEAPRSAPSTGDGSVGRPGGVSFAQVDLSLVPDRETVLFWSHLALASLIGGVTDAAVTSATPVPVWGATHPAAPIGGGFHVKDADGGASGSLPGWPPLAAQPNGTLLVLQNAVDRDLVPLAAGSQVLTPHLAEILDRKIDDGDPFRGSLLGYGNHCDPRWLCRLL